jgi:hypothetical protein
MEAITNNIVVECPVEIMYCLANMIVDEKGAFNAKLRFLFNDPHLSIWCSIPDVNVGMLLVTFTTYNIEHVVHNLTIYIRHHISNSILKIQKLYKSANFKITTRSQNIRIELYHSDNQCYSEIIFEGTSFEFNTQDFPSLGK